MGPWATAGAARNPAALQPGPIYAGDGHRLTSGANGSLPPECHSATASKGGPGLFGPGAGAREGFRPEGEKPVP